MQVTALTFLIIISSYYCSAKLCKPDYFWRPFKGEIPTDAFIAGEDANRNPTYVAKIVPLDQYLWTTPVQLFYGENFVNFAWYGSNSQMKIDKFIHILCIDEKHSLQWVDVNKHSDEIINHCCLVEGGIGKFPNNQYVYTAFVARKKVNNVSYVGRSYNKRNWSGIHIMVGTNSTKILTDYELLTYNCDQPKIQLINIR